MIFVSSVGLSESYIPACQLNNGLHYAGSKNHVNSSLYLPIFLFHFCSMQANVTSLFCVSVMFKSIKSFV